MHRWILCSLFVGFSTLISTLPPQALAGPITYTETVVGSGSFGGQTFTNDLITITAVTDTANVGPGFFPGLVDTFNSSASVNVAGIGSALFLDTTYTFDYQPGQTAGIGDATYSSDILDVTAPPLGTYGLTTSIGPVSGPTIINSGFQFGTTLGTFEIDSTSSNGTFQATATPEPSTLVLSGIATCCLIVLRLRRSGRAAV